MKLEEIFTTLATINILPNVENVIKRSCFFLSFQSIDKLKVV